MSHAQEITKALGGVWRGERGLTLCPCHDDARPSLRITDANGKNGDVVVYCFAGCDWREVKDVLRTRGFLPERRLPTIRERTARILRGIKRQGRMLEAERQWRDDAKHAAMWPAFCSSHGETVERSIPAPVLARLAALSGPDLAVAIDATARLHRLPPAFIADAVRLFSAEIVS